MLRVTYPPTYDREREYILRVLFGDWLGVEYETATNSAGCVQISRMGDAEDRKLEVSDQLFRTPRPKWLTRASLPRQIEQWKPGPALPGAPPQLALLFARRLDNGDYIVIRPDLIQLGVDLFGGVFFMLTRYEEIANQQRDEFDRFASSHSILPTDVLERAIVNEYVELLWWALRRLWPDLLRKPRAYRCLLSCDVDLVSVMGAPARHALRILAGRSVRDALREGPWYGAFGRAHHLWRAWRGNPGADTLDDFDFLMDQAEQVGSRFVFNLLVGHGKSGKDALYDVGSHGIRRLMRRIHGRGHELGFHGSYETFQDPDRIQHEFASLTRVAAEEGLQQAQWGGRQHYLRWVAPTTWQGYEDAGLAYDSSISYADHAGFRCGTCYEFPAFNLETRQSLRLHERPLIVMEKSLLAPAYMGLTASQAVEKVAELSRTCRRFEGDFTLLWHNGQTQIREMRGVFVQMLRAAGASQPVTPVAAKTLT